MACWHLSTFVLQNIWRLTESCKCALILSYILIWLRSDQSDVLTIGQPTLSYCSKAHSFLLCNQLSSGISREFNHSATDHWSALLAKILINYMNPKPLHASFLARLYNQKFVFWTWFATYCGQFMQLLTTQNRLLHFMMTSDIVNIHNYSLDIAADGYSVFFWVVSPFFGMWWVNCSVIMSF